MSTVVSILAAGTVFMNECEDLPASIILSWYSGCEGGSAPADIITGKANPAGLLPFSIPESEEQLHYFDKDATSITYDRWHGQHLLDRLKVEPAYPLGFGLSYTTFAVENVKAMACGKEGLTIRVTVKNTRSKAGRFVARVYGSADVPDRPKRLLLGFGVVDLKANEKKEFTIEGSTRPLQEWGNGV